MSRGPEASTLLKRAIETSAERAGVTIHVTASTATSWASATFTGARHHLTLTGADDGLLAEWLGALPEAELTMRGHIVADLIIADIARADGAATVGIEALSVEAR